MTPPLGSSNGGRDQRQRDLDSVISGLPEAIAIALTVAVNPLEIGGAEFRFLRKELDMSQRAIAGVLGVQEQTVSLWERGEQPVPQYAAVLISAMAREYFSGQAAMKTVIDRVCSADLAIAKAKLLIERTDHGSWMQKAA